MQHCKNRRHSDTKFSRSKISTKFSTSSGGGGRGVIWDDLP
eukprot:SAG31_NODE_29618_length_392_cov_1.051195_1_plen_40_part_10